MIRDRSHKKYEKESMTGSNITEKDPPQPNNFTTYSQYLKKSKKKEFHVLQ